MGATIARLNELRSRAELQAREASLRVTLTHEVRRGLDAGIVLRRLAAELDDLLDLDECAVVLGPDTTPSATVPEDVLVHVPPLLVRLRPRRPLAAVDLAAVRDLATAVGAAIDLERLERETSERRVQHELEQSRAAMLTAVTHDLRTPLATIKAASNALLAPGGRLDADERRELLEDTRSEAERLERLVDKVLEMGRIRSGALQPELEVSAPIDVVQTGVERRTAALGEREIVVAVDADLPPIDVDAVLLEQVFANLLENAALHSGSDSPVEIHGDRHGGCVRLSVVDHGAGVPPGDRERIFDEFVRRRAPTDGAGTGLGLTVVRALVGAHRGRVWCEGTPGGGATFVVELPISDEGSEV